MSPFRPALLFALFSASACIEVSQSTAVGDGLVETVDPGDAPDADDAVDVGEPVSCDASTPCVGELAECERWACIGGYCQRVPQSGIPCAESDQCSIGVCQEGRCISVPRMCPSDDPCRKPVCAPALGCDTVPVDGGFCESNAAFPWGECVGPLMAPPDRCDAEGACLDIGVGGPRAPAFPALAGAWFVVRHVANGFGQRTRFGSLALTLASDLATVSWEPLADSAGALPEAPVGRPGSWCLDPRGGFNINFPDEGAWIGHVAASGDVIGGTRLNNNEIVMGLRPDTGGRKPDGTYRVAFIQEDPRAALDSWVGTLVFSDGCLVGEPVLRHSDETNDLILKKAECFAASDLNAAGPLSTADFVISGGPSEERRIAWVGAVVGAGDIGLFGLRDGNGNSLPGFVVAVREGPVVVAPASNWFAAWVERRPTSVDTFVYSGMRLMATVADGRFTGGHIERVRDASTTAPPFTPRAENLLDGGFAIRPSDGLAVLSPRFDERRRHWAGVINDRSGVGIVFEVPPGGDPGGQYPLRPLWPSIGIMVGVP